MNILKSITMAAGFCLILSSCGSKAGDTPFKYSIDEFADIEILRYQIPGWDELSLNQKEYIYHPCQAFL